jgi:hypothetical protein
MKCRQRNVVREAQQREHFPSGMTRIGAVREDGDVIPGIFGIFGRRYYRYIFPNGKMLTRLGEGAMVMLAV